MPSKHERDYGWGMDARKVTHGAKLPSPNMGVKWRPAWAVHETPRRSAKFSSCDPFKTARLNQAGGKNKLCRSCGVTATLATKNHKALYSLSRDHVQKLQTLAARSRPGGPVPVARPRWPGPRSRSRCRGPAPVPVARSRSRFKGACPRGRAKKDLFCIRQQTGLGGREEICKVESDLPRRLVVGYQSWPRSSSGSGYA